MKQNLSMRIGSVGLAALLLGAGVATPAAAESTADETLGTLSGRLVDSSGEAVIGEVSTRPTGDGSWEWTRTDSDGNWSLDVLPGQYHVQFEVDEIRQYAYGSIDLSDAETFDVSAGETVTVDDVLLPNGTVTGTFTDVAGEGIGGVSVRLIPHDSGNPYRSAVTDSSGQYAARVLAGDYSVRFVSSSPLVDQYAFGVLTRSEAAVIAVADGETVVVDDVRLATGSVLLRAEDAVTGGELTEFNAGLAGQFDNTTSGELLLTDVPAGEHDLTSASAPGYTFTGSMSVTVVADTQTEVTIPLMPRARVETTVVDAATGEPVAGVCLIAATRVQFRMPEWCSHVSDANGDVMVEVNEGGTYQLLAWPRDAEGYGAQWVGRRGGTGHQLLAARVSVDDGGVATAPLVRMDPAGSISGVVTGADGDPLSSGSIRFGNHGFNVGAGLGGADIEADGTYTIDQLGPYRWPLQFQSFGHASQWSGGVPSRLMSRGVAVAPGETTTHNYEMKPGTDVSLTMEGQSGAGFVVALDARTGDRLAAWWIDSNAETDPRPVLGPQLVKFRLFFSSDRSYVGGDDFESAETFVIQSSGEQTVDLS